MPEELLRDAREQISDDEFAFVHHNIDIFQYKIATLVYVHIAELKNTFSHLFYLFGKNKLLKEKEHGIRFTQMWNNNAGL